jgi:hypothetical protein
MAKKTAKRTAAKRTAANKHHEIPLVVRDYGNLSVLSWPEAAPVPARLHVWAPVPGLSTGVLSLPGERGAVVIWQIFEDLQLVQTSAVCPGDVRFIRRRAVLYAPSDSYELAWSDGSPVGCRVTAPVPDAEVAVVRLQKV